LLTQSYAAVATAPRTAHQHADTPHGLALLRVRRERLCSHSAAE
jgi:hypothetical protein